MIFIDSNVPMYLVGAAHPLRQQAVKVLESLVLGTKRLVTDAEVLQEILHRYRSIGRPIAIQPAYDALLGVVDDVLPIELVDTERARDILLARWSLSAQAALHVAVMQRHGIEQILSFDADFDAVPGIERLA